MKVHEEFLASLPPHMRAHCEREYETKLGGEGYNAYLYQQHVAEKIIHDHLLPELMSLQGVGPARAHKLFRKIGGAREYEVWIDNLEQIMHNPDTFLKAQKPLIQLSAQMVGDKVYINSEAKAGNHFSRKSVRAVREWALDWYTA